MFIISIKDNHEILSPTKLKITNFIHIIYKAAVTVFC